MHEVMSNSKAGKAGQQITSGLPAPADQSLQTSKPTAHIDFLGEIYPLAPETPVTIGRDADIVIDDNPYLHRRFLEIAYRDSLVWITNQGNALTATISDEAGQLQAWLAPGARLPLVFPQTTVWFTAGPTTYEFDIFQQNPPYESTEVSQPESGDTTVGRVSFTPEQQLLILALAEDVLRRGNRGTGHISTSADAARRLGWALTKFNRKLDNVCDKLTRAGVRGLHGNSAKLATGRKARLVEYAIASRLIVAEDLALLEANQHQTDPPAPKATSK